MQHEQLKTYIILCRVNCCQWVYVGWWLAALDSKVGWVPSSFLEPPEEELEESVTQSSEEVETSAGDGAGECLFCANSCSRHAILSL